jgi:hypothetical protein
VFDFVVPEHFVDFHAIIGVNQTAAGGLFPPAGGHSFYARRRICLACEECPARSGDPPRQKKKESGQSIYVIDFMVDAVGIEFSVKRISNNMQVSG